LRLASDGCAAAAAAAEKSSVYNATTVAGQPVVLHCVMPMHHYHHHHQRIVWLRPSDGLPVPLHSDSAADADSVGPAARFVVIGNATAGQHHLLLRYTVFPGDAGRWTCASLSDSQLVQHTQLTVLVPPPSQVSVVVVVVELLVVVEADVASK